MPSEHHNRALPAAAVAWALWQGGRAEERTVSTGPIERKVQASTAAAAASGLLLWILGRYVFKGAVPDVIASWVYAAVPGVLAFAAGYLAKHTNRPDTANTLIAAGVSAKQVINALAEPPPSVTELQAPPAPPAPPQA